nr:DUF418 domain-containing protein [Streptomyces sp. SAJ15]
MPTGVATGVWLITVFGAYALERAGRRGPVEAVLRRLVYRGPRTARELRTPNGTSAHVARRGGRRAGADWSRAPPGGRARCRRGRPARETSGRTDPGRT